MIRVDQASCAGCGVCVDECPTGAVDLVNGTAVIDAHQCEGEGCLACVAICPNQALAWVEESIPEATAKPSALAVVEPPVEVTVAETQAPVPWRRAILPAVGSAAAWVGRELVPRLAPLALDALESALDRREPGRPAERNGVPTSPSGERGPGRQKRRRRRGRGRSSE